ncbi:MAG: prephenate dehydrogenase, partial [Acidobacteria bacterium]|nr:prephenate dehydrogenase [Acidobacteriota bacterium]
QTVKIEEIGLVGLGRFGKMVYDYLRCDKKLLVYDHDSQKLQGVSEAATFEEVLSAPLIVLCVPISAVEKTCQKMASFLREGQIVVDTCSVKKRPVEWMLAHLPESVQVLGTHPLFGPDSGKQGIAGLKIALSPVRIERKTYAGIRNYLEKLQLVIVETTPEEHDKQIAQSQAVFHLIAQVMKQLRWASQAISTPGPEAFHLLVRTVQQDTDQLFLDMERENPYAAECRQEFVQEILKLERELSGA